ncbi:hypothetical protein TYRP_009556 [Tyrophagus putrescentiae]|nr:hypothetical protein TYRP_009556 [Tyrophagus putrescentiae]
MTQPPISFLVILITSIITIITTTTQACSLGSKTMSACLHRYLERDFSLLEDLLRRPPYGENGHILIEEGELAAMCSKLAELKSCYEAVFTEECVSFNGYAQMKRILKVMRLVHGHFCEDHSLQGIKDLIEGGYCIEHVRKGSICGSDHPTLETANETVISEADLSLLKSVSPKHRWPYTMTAMLRFEAGVNVCAYLGAFTRCMTPNVQLRCRDESRTVWRNSSTAILKEWCGQFCWKSHSKRTDPSIPYLVYLSSVLELKNSRTLKK